MRSPITILFLTALVLCFLGAPVDAVDHTYEVSFDTQLDTSTSLCSQDFVFIQNLDSSSITIDDLSLHWNDAASSSGSGDGVTIHGGSGSCSLISSTALAAGGGITLFVGAAASQCTTEFPD